MSKHKIHLLCLFDYQCTTGFATVSHNVIRELKAHYGELLWLDILAVNYFGQPTNPDERTKIIPAALAGEEKARDPFGRKVFLKLLQQSDFDGIFIIQDMGVILPMASFIGQIKLEKQKANRKNFKSIFYFPVDTKPLTDYFTNFHVFDKLVVYTEYGRNEILKVDPSLKPKLQVILHGVNPRNFYPLSVEKTEKFRSNYFGDHAAKTIVTNVNRNQPRKDIPTTIFAFQNYKATYNGNAFLYLHMTPQDEMGWNLFNVLKQTDLVDGIDYMFPLEESYNAGASMDLLNGIYNASDVFLNTTSGEGFGLTILEAMMCKCPVIAPGHTSISEIGGNGTRIFEIETLYPYCTHYDSMVRYQSDYLEAAELINVAVTEKEVTAGKVKAAYEFAESITWDKICERWLRLFRDTF